MDDHEDEEHKNEQQMHDIIVYFALFTGIVLIWIRYSWGAFYGCIPKIPVRQKWPPFLFAFLMCIIIGLFISCLVLEISMQNKRDKIANTEESPVTKTLNHVSNQVNASLQALYAVRTLQESEFRFPNATDIVSKLSARTKFNDIAKLNLIGIDMTKLGDALNEVKKNCPNEEKTVDSIKKDAERFNVYLYEINGFKELVSNISKGGKFEGIDSYAPEKEFNDDITSIHEHLMRVERFFENFLKSLDESKSFLKEIYDRKTAYQRDKLWKGIIKIYIPLAFILPTVCFSIFIHLYYRNSPVDNKILSFLVSASFFLVAFFVIYLAIVHIYFEHAEETICSKSEYKLFEQVMLPHFGSRMEDKLNDEFVKCAKKNEKFDVKVMLITSGRFLRGYGDGILKIVRKVVLNRVAALPNDNFVTNATERINKFKTTGLNCSKNYAPFHTHLESLSKFFNKAHEFREKMEFGTLKEMSVSAIEGSLKSIVEQSEKWVKQINDALFHIDFNCDDVYSLVKPCDKDTVDGLEIDLDSIMTACSVCFIILHMLAFRRNDLSQFSNDNRQRWIRKMNKNPISMIEIYNEKLKDYISPKASFDYFEANKQNNRYPNIPCNDEHRVVLNGWNHYIHANWIRIPKHLIDPLTHRAMPGKVRQYIVTQAPIDDTCADFWSMCWQENVGIVLMLCGFVENGHEKCAEYLPGKIGETLEFKKDRRLSVKCVDVRNHSLKGVEHRILEVRVEDELYGSAKTVNHLIVNWWPDKGVPDDVHQLIDLYNWVKKKSTKLKKKAAKEQLSSAICVHSSSGIGRAATFVAFDYCYARIFEDACFDTAELVREMRAYRFGAVENAEQYIYLNVALLEYMSIEGICDTELGLKLIDDYENFLRGGGSATTAATTNTTATY
ncbi:unnamed protein product [Caenorhabditis angaria]|uniref:Tyrosine-protein phosphatase domain-containing protein n=1 Tax=Caenorhabditis angaria TaxID=860376 RepID=A0A9P1MYL2_9PELO|nr:unnamed protein product [Caenorhabditis angaria]